MRRIRGGVSVVIFLAFMQAFAGCGGGGGGGHKISPAQKVYTANILSDWYSDGDIGYLAGDPTPYIVTQGWDQGVSFLLFGFDANNDGREYRAFLTFPLDGAAGDAVPLSASIESATLVVNIAGVDVSSVRVGLDLVEYIPGWLHSGDYSKPPLAIRSEFNLYDSDEGFDVAIDVTSLMIEAQAQALMDFQVRFRVTNNFGLAAVEDEEYVAITAPMLVVRYY